MHTHGQDGSGCVDYSVRHKTLNVEWAGGGRKKNPSQTCHSEKSRLELSLLGKQGFKPAEARF